MIPTAPRSGWTRPTRVTSRLAIMTTAALVSTVALTAVIAPGTASAAQYVTEEYTYASAENVWVVPQGVTSATFTVTGAQGGGAPFRQNEGTLFQKTFAPGGRGAQVKATIPVSPGERYFVSASQPGGDAGKNKDDFGYGGLGCAPGGAGNTGSKKGSASGGGGGSSCVYKLTTQSPYSTPVIIAGGGGGAGGYGSGTGGTKSPNGGDGGNAGADGGTAHGQGGRGGHATTGKKNQPTSMGMKGDNATTATGGGGGGGGGGGRRGGEHGTAGGTFRDVLTTSGGGGGGGGGGTNYYLDDIDASVELGSTRSAGRVEISYLRALPVTVTVEPLATSILAHSEVDATVRVEGPSGHPKPQGKVSLQHAGTFLNSMPLIEGIAVIPIRMGDLGPGTLTATYHPADSEPYSSAAAVAPVTIFAKAHLQAEAESVEAVFGEPITFAYQALHRIAGEKRLITGKVELSDWGTTVRSQPLVSGQAAFHGIAGEVGERVVTARLIPELPFMNEDLDLSTPVTIRAASTTTSLILPESSVIGDTVPAEACVSAVAPSLAPITGQVQLLRDGGPLGAPLTLTQGCATTDITAANAGTHSYTAQYLGTQNLGASESTLEHTSSKAPTQTILKLDSTDLRWGESTAAQIAVSHSGAASGDISGSVEIRLDGRTIKTVDAATLPGGDLPGVLLNNLEPGSYALTAHYLGSERVEHSDSEAVSFTVREADTRMERTGGDRDVNSRAGEPAEVGYTVVSDTGTTPGGEIFLLDDSNNEVATAPLVDGTATLVVPAGPVVAADAEAVAYSAGYRPDARHSRSEAPGFAHHVAPGETHLTLKPTVDPKARSAAGSWTVSAAAGYDSSIPVTGLVQFALNGEPVGEPVELENAEASWTVPELKNGDYSLTASYLGSADYLPADSAAETFVIDVTEEDEGTGGEDDHNTGGEDNTDSGSGPGAETDSRDKPNTGTTPHGQSGEGLAQTGGESTGWIAVAGLLTAAGLALLTILRVRTRRA